MPGPARLCRILTSLAVATAVALVPASAAVAAKAGGNGQFSITPAPGSNGVAGSYFMLTVPAGGSATGTAILANLGSTPETLRLGRSTGVTADNGGSAYSRAFQNCAGPGCWVTDPQATAALPAHARERLTFTVRVPAGTRPGQYLAGLTAELAVPPRPVRIGSNHSGAAARAIIIRQSTVGVAVTVGSLSRLTTRLMIPTVSGLVVGQTPRLNILLRNTGQTFTHATGTASCTATGKRYTYRVLAATVLPDDQAVIPANAPGLPAGTTVPCAVRLRYGARLSVSWAGQVTVPDHPAVRIEHTEPGPYAALPPAIPAWSITLIVIGALALAALAVPLLRRRRRQPGRRQPRRS